MKSRTALPAVSLLLAAACTAPPDFEPIDAEVRSFLTEVDLEGANLVIVTAEDGVVHQSSFGTHTAERISLIASASKVMSAGVLMKLSDDGLLDLDAPVSETLSEWGTFKTDITPAHLLSNSSGMVGLTDDATYSPYLCQYLSTSDLKECAEQIYSADDEEDRVPPDTAYRYGGGGWHLAGGVAVQASGKDWDTLIDETYVQPCGLENTGYRNHYARAFLQGSVADALVYPDFFDGDLDDLLETTNPNIEGGAYTTVGDYAKILQVHLGDGTCNGNRVLSEASLERMRTDRIGPAYDGFSGNEDYPGYGLAWFTEADGPVVSDPGAFGATPWVDRERGYAAFVLLERGYSDGVDLRDRLRPMLEELYPVPETD